MTEEINKIVKRLKESILSSGYSYAELEKLTGISRSSLQRYANGVTAKIPIDAIQTIAKAVDIDAKYIMGWTDSEIPYTSKDENTNNNFSNHEKKVITAYRNKPEMQPAVDKLLGVEEEVLIPTVKAARSKDNSQPIEIVNLPDLSKFEPDDTDL